MSRRARTRTKMGRVLSDLANTPPDDSHDEDHEGGIDILFRDGLDLAALDVPADPRAAMTEAQRFAEYHNRYGVQSWEL